MDFGGKTKNQKTAENKRKKRKDSMSSVNDDDDVDLDGMDWWSKYHASVELLLSVICRKQVALIYFVRMHQPLVGMLLTRISMRSSINSCVA